MNPIVQTLSTLTPIVAGKFKKTYSTYSCKLFALTFYYIPPLFHLSSSKSYSQKSTYYQKGPPPPPPLSLTMLKPVSVSLNRTMFSPNFRRTMKMLSRPSLLRRFFGGGFFESLLLLIRKNKVCRPYPWEFILWGRLSADLSRNWLKIWQNALEKTCLFARFEFSRLRLNFPAVEFSNGMENKMAGLLFSVTPRTPRQHRLWKGGSVYSKYSKAVKGSGSFIGSALIAPRAPSR